MSGGNKETVSITFSKEWQFANDFRMETEDGKLLSALCKYCSEVECNYSMREASSRNIKGSAVKSICFFEKVLRTFIEVHLPSCRNFNFFS